LVEDAITLLIRLLVDKALGGQVGDKLVDAFEAAAHRLFEHVGPGFQAAVTSLETWVAPLRQRMEALAASMPTELNAEQMAATGEAFVDLIADLAAGVTTNQIRDGLDRLLRMLRQDIGFTDAYLGGQINALLDDFAARCLAITGDSGDARDNRLAIVAILRRLRRSLANKWTLPPLNSEQLAGPLFAWMRSAGTDEIAQKIACIADKVKNGLRLSKGVLSAIPFTGVSAGSIGQAGMSAANLNAEKSWYGHWLFDSDWGIDQPKAGSEYAPRFEKITFKHVDREAMEGVAFHGRWVRYALETLLHLTSLEEGDYISSSLHATRSLTDTIVLAAAKYEIPWVVRHPIDLAISFLAGGFEGRGLDQFDEMLYLVRVGIDLFEAYLYQFYSRLAYNFTLSILTLLNHDGQTLSQEFVSGTSLPQPDNRRFIRGAALPFMDLGALILAAAVPYDWYSFDFRGRPGTRPATGEFFATWLAGGLGMSLLSAFVGTVFAGAWSLAYADVEDYAYTWLTGLGFATLNFPLYWFLVNDGATDGGKIGLLPNAGRGQRVAFRGYPDPSTSPYRLPYASGQSIECIQGNHGIASHNSVSQPIQVYAYDFSMNLNANVLCMRPGIVFSFVDTTPTGNANTGQPGNNIVIQHTTIDGNHDSFSPAAGVVAGVTYSSYVHGVQNSIMAAFAARGITLATRDIVPTINPLMPAPYTNLLTGTINRVVSLDAGGNIIVDAAGFPVEVTVAQGQTIMTCDHTGVSQFNHLHVQVVPNVLPTPIVDQFQFGNLRIFITAVDAAGNATVTDNAPAQFTIPFTFNEVGGDGAPKKFDYYTSANTPVP
jgi:hypothetical protein